MKEVDKSILKKLTRPEPMSHKGHNGRLLVIAGSDKYHGALNMTVQTAARIVDMVYVHSVEQNLKMIRTLKSEIATFISVSPENLWQTVELVDAIVIGPGLAENDNTISVKRKLLQEFSDKKTIIDATAMWHLDPELLHPNCILTPHSREFENVFKTKASPEAVQAMAKKYNCTIVLTGTHDYISNGKDLWENKTGNVGMTKGGTGDVLAGMICAFATTNDCLTATLAGTFLNGYAGDRLYDRVGTFFSAEDLIEEVGRVWKELV